MSKLNCTIKFNIIPFFVMLLMIMVVIVTLQSDTVSANTTGNDEFRIVLDYEYKTHTMCDLYRPHNVNKKVFYITKSRTGEIPPESSKMYYFLEKENKLGWSTYGYCSESLVELKSFYESGLYEEQQLSGKVYKLIKENKL